jgi:hypothetical protein
VDAPSSATAGELLERLATHGGCRLFVRTLRSPPHKLLAHSLRQSLRHAGRLLPDGAPLALGVLPGEAVQLFVRELGGGGDGGATGAESRSSYLEMYKEAGSGKLDAREEQLAKWTCCRLTRAPLGGTDGTRPVVVCPLGCMYDREAVLNALKEKAVDGIPLPPLVAHIRSHKELTTLRLQQDAPGGAGPGEKLAADATDFRQAEHVRFCCPLTSLQLSGRYRFFALLPSGVVVSERALKSAPAAVEELLGGAALASQTRVPLYGSAEEVEALRASAAAAAPAKRKAGKAAVPVKRMAFAVSDTARRPGVVAPAGATPEIWSSIFTSSHGPTVETFAARNLTVHR